MTIANLKRIRRSILETIARLRAAVAERQLRHEAKQFGVRYVGLFEPYHLAVFQDPVTGSSFAIKEGDTLESGIGRVRARFGMAI